MIQKYVLSYTLVEFCVGVGGICLFLYGRMFYKELVEV